MGYPMGYTNDTMGYPMGYERNPRKGFHEQTLRVQGLGEDRHAAAKPQCFWEPPLLFSAGVPARSGMSRQTKT